MALSNGTNARLAGATSEDRQALLVELLREQVAAHGGRAMPVREGDTLLGYFVPVACATQPLPQEDTLEFAAEMRRRLEPTERVLSEAEFEGWWKKEKARP